VTDDAPRTPTSFFAALPRSTDSSPSWGFLFSPGSLRLEDATDGRAGTEGARATGSDRDRRSEEVLEDNAEEFVKSHVQQGGE